MSYRLEMHNLTTTHHRCSSTIMEVAEVAATLSFNKTILKIIDIPSVFESALLCSFLSLQTLWHMWGLGLLFLIESGPAVHAFNSFLLIFQGWPQQHRIKPWRQFEDLKIRTTNPPSLIPIVVFICNGTFLF